MLPIAIAARAAGIKNLVIPAANAREAAVVQGVNVYPVKSLLEVRELLNAAEFGTMTATPLVVDTSQLLDEAQEYHADFRAMCAGSMSLSALSKLQRQAGTTS